MRVLRVEGPLDEASLIQLMKQEPNLKVRRWFHILILVKKGHSALDTAELLQVHEKTVLQLSSAITKKGCKDWK